MTPIFLEYRVIDHNITFYIIYVFINNLTLKFVTMYVINPNSHTILIYNVSLEPQQIFSNISGNITYYTLNGHKILAYNSRNLIVAKNGLILKEKINNNSLSCLVSANFPGIANDSFPNLYKLADIHIFNKKSKFIITGVLFTFATSLLLVKMVRKYDKIS
ncbi:hypothetical protein [Sulfurisphaera tokodaii]|uniref:Uncharacterized protein n=2 Tax=Sulfurisphaera tokodaii TaxID=111955 RepID=Q96XJ7_SULTO|nr:hypothetical protein [Sulfurisphaera tokodaii]BAB67630.1 hypothetical protein STK_25170 [Sulfurisphaera tokodaii str. 7]HII75315.1 hypothetical protein [Sulfurisphaera tokodaii]